MAAPNCVVRVCALDNTSLLIKAPLLSIIWALMLIWRAPASRRPRLIAKLPSCSTSTGDPSVSLLFDLSIASTCHRPMTSSSKAKSRPLAIPSMPVITVSIWSWLRISRSTRIIGEDGTPRKSKVFSVLMSGARLYQLSTLTKYSSQGASALNTSGNRFKGIEL